MRRRSFRSLRALGWLTGALGIVLALLAAEAYLRSTERFANYWELNGLKGGPTQALVEPFLLLRRKNKHLTDRKKEFSQEIRTNEEGLTGVLPPLKKGRNERRIIAIGDSFTEGVGDPEGHGYVGRLERRLKRLKPPPQITIMNAGVSGSDPVFGLELLRRKLLKYGPDLVLLTVNQSDIDDLQRRGGLDRFTPEGELRDRRPAWGELFVKSHLVRALVLGWLHYNWSLESPVESARSNELAITDIVRAATLAKELAASNGFKLLIVVHPVWYEVAQGALRPELVKVEEGLRAAQVEYADLLREFMAEIPSPISKEYYWPRDAHFTPKGYEVFAHALELELGKRGYLGPSLGAARQH